MRSLGDSNYWEAHMRTLARARARRVAARGAMLAVAAACIAIPTTAAQATTSVTGGGASDTGALIIDPSSSPTDALTLQASPGDAAVIQDMPRDMTIDEVTIGNIARGTTCTSNSLLQLYIREIDSSGNTSQIAYSNNTPSVGTTAGNVTFNLSSTLLDDDKGYLFRLGWAGGCSTINQTTWDHNQAQVNPGTALCTAGHPGTGWRRMWHEYNEDDRQTACVGYVDPDGDGWHPDMPTGWLVSFIPGSTWMIMHGTPNPNRPATDVCIAGANGNLFGAGPTAWRANTVGQQYVCEWSQWADHGTTVTDGWYYGLPWPTQRTGEPRDVYLKLD